MNAILGTSDLSGLVEEIKSSNQKAFKQFFQIFYKDIYRYVFNRVSNKIDAEDLVQEIFLKFWNSRKTINNSGFVKTFLFTIAKNRIIDHYKKVKFDSEEVTENTYIHTDEMTSSETLRELVTELISELPEAHKTVFLLNRFDGFKYQEIADSLGISVKTVEKYMSSTMKFLKEKTKENNMLEVFIIMFFNLF